MKVMAIDLGDVRTGVALSDVTGFLAGRSVTITQRDHNKLLEELLGIIEAEKPGEIVLGLPINMDGSEGPRAEKSRVFGARLEQASGLPVKYMDERGTSVTANRILSDAGKKRGKQRARVDAVAAAIILQSYLDSRPR
ncbi:MAG: Holliday junction resolvase RuvX [Clostridia bacterium]|nr:Holliday junction resolvase RuvX [Clostridia bacterium]